MRKGYTGAVVARMVVAEYIERQNRKPLDRTLTLAHSRTQKQATSTGTSLRRNIKIKIKGRPS